MANELSKITNLLGDLEEEPLLALVKERMAANDDPMAIVEACRKGMQIVGERFTACEYFVSELIVSAELFNSVMKILGPKLSAGKAGKPKTKVVFGTAQGDVHDIGKNIAVAMLRCDGYEVYDVGTDVPPKVFVDKVKETGATIVGFSGLLTVAFSAMEATVKALKDAGLKNKVKVIIGGCMVNEFVRNQTGADAWGRDAMEAVKLTKSFSGER